MTTGGDLKLGAVFPTCEIGNDPGAIRDFAQTAEGLGYSHLVVYDHVLGAEHAGREPKLTGPYTERDPFHEPFVLYGFLAAATSRIELATGVLILPQRQTALVAKQAAEVALLSRGRLRLGVGTGWNWVEYEALNESFDSRGKRLDEQVELLRALWRGEPIDFDGRFHRVERAGILPAPPGPIPIWFGGFTPPAVRRAARIGDGFLFGAATRPMQGLCNVLHGALAQAGRDPADFGIEAIVSWSDGADAWRESAETWKKLGATHFSMRAMDTGAALMGETPPGFTTPREHIEALEPFAEAL
ncbi:MAG: LLM class F420-dependent oxidoreductase, partial [Myxococcota bacterium]